jgi:ribonuclease HI
MSLPFSTLQLVSKCEGPKQLPRCTEKREIPGRKKEQSVAARCHPCRERLLASALAAPPGTPKRTLIPSPATDDSSMHRVSGWFRGASGEGQLLKEGQKVEQSYPRPRNRTPWAPPTSPVLHAWTDGSFRTSAGLGWVVTRDAEGAGDIVAQGSRSLGTRQTAFDAEVSAIKEALDWFFTEGNGSGYRSLIIHSDSTSAIARASHTGAGLGQRHAIEVHKRVSRPRTRTVDIQWVKGHSRVRQRAGRQTGGRGGGEDWPVHSHVSSPPQAEDLRAVPRC